jgi:hypothetical protein
MHSSFREHLRLSGVAYQMLMGGNREKSKTSTKSLWILSVHASEHTIGTLGKSFISEPDLSSVHVAVLSLWELDNMIN